jgi:hypothetical protein
VRAGDIETKHFQILRTSQGKLMPRRLPNFARRVVGLFLVSFFVLALAPRAESQDVLTYHNNPARTGLNDAETILTPLNVNSTSFGLKFNLIVDGKVDAQPLFISNVNIPGSGPQNLLVVATEHDSVYAFAADRGVKLWQASVLNPGETTADPMNCSQVAPEIGVTATPVISRTQGPNGAIYVVAMSKDGMGLYHQRLHALDLTTGAELFGGPMEIRGGYPGTGDNSTGGRVTFDPQQYVSRPGLLLFNGVVYMAWGSHCDNRPYTGWVMGYNATTLAKQSVLNLAPNGSGAAVWMAGAGLAADLSGNIYILVANGDFDTNLDAKGFPVAGNYGNSFVKISTANGLVVADYFEMHNQQEENADDVDLGSGGVLVVPDMVDAMGRTRFLAVGAGKDSNIYLVDRNSMGKFDPIVNHIRQEIDGALPGGIRSAPAFFNNRIYYGSVGLPIYAFQFGSARLSGGPVMQTANLFGYPGTSPSISANGVTHAILWAVKNGTVPSLHAYRANTLVELYNSNETPNGRDNFGAASKFVTPTIANGQVFVGTTNSVAVFGLR